MKTTITKLRKDLYKQLDKVIETGTPLEIERKGKIIKIILSEKKSKLSNLKKHAIIEGSPEDIINIDWYKEWDQNKNLI